MNQLNTSGDSSSSSNVVPVRFGMPQALVILGFLAAAVVLHLVAHTEVQDTALLLAAAGAVSVAVLISTGFHRGGRGHGGLLRRLLKAALSSGSSN
ncbi:hypothetical protein QA942_39510 [Streptomyces sp. B21-106]|uniref:hypothetical protein n=1 Tax=Streptomyces sp. B21-106 TaxID=3039418 RepID=UPI002FF19D65